MSEKNEFDDLFAPETSSQSTDKAADKATPWTILLVDDEPDVHAILKLALNDVEVEARPLEILEAQTAEQALEMLHHHPEIALILLDVVMESEHAGLDVVRHIRKTIENHQIQILLITGQPGYAPLHQVIKDYEINGYYQKSELTNDRIFSSVYSSLRTYHIAQMLEQQRQALEISEQRYIDYYENSPDMYVSVDAKTARVRECNQTLCNNLGYTKSEIIGKEIFQLYHPDCMPEVKNAFKSFIETGIVTNAELQLKKKNGNKVDVNLNVTSVRDAEGNVLYSRSCWIDISERKEKERQLLLAEDVFKNSQEGIIITNNKADIIRVNHAFTEITGYSSDEVLGKNPRVLKSGNQDKEFYKNMWHDILNNGVWQGEVWNRRKDGSVFAALQTISAVHDSRGKTEHYVGIFSDITLQKKQHERLEYIAHYDVLTELPNRILLSDRLQHAMTQEKRRSLQLGVVFLDLDGFKEVNDTYGHNVGDYLLSTIAERLKNNLREGDTIARLGGDEFVIVLIDLNDRQDCIPLLERFLDAASQPIIFDTLTHQVSASLGITFYPQEEDVDADQLLRQADHAMYQAKQAGKNRFKFFDAELDKSVRDQHEFIKQVYEAIVKDEFVLFFQPKVNMRTGELSGVEALIRWQHPERGLLPPSSFLPYIEKDAVYTKLDDWVIKRSLEYLSQWQSEGLRIPLSINLGALKLQQQDFTPHLKAQLERFPDLDYQYFEIEILETSALKDMNHVSSIIYECKKLGIKFALDDFGTGFSSLSYLKRLPVESIKVDQSFIRNILNDPEDLAILDGVLSLSDAFHQQTIAEGVETIDHGVLLLLLGCELAQGYGISKPLPAFELLDWINSWQPAAIWEKIPQVKKYDKQALFAITQQRAFLKNIELPGYDKSADKDSELEQCYFRQWIEGAGKKHYGQKKVYSQLVGLHDEFHRVGSQIINRRKKSKAKSGVKKLQKISDEIYSCLLKLLL